MAIYKVATGNRYDGQLGTDGQLNWEKLQKIQPGAHCTWAECRYSGFQMDEVIVYKNEQSTYGGWCYFGSSLTKTEKKKAYGSFTLPYAFFSFYIANSSSPQTVVPQAPDR